MEESRIKDIYAHLQSNGIDTYFPSQKGGECISPYVVVKQGVSSRYSEYSTTITYYDLLCYVPKEHYGDLHPFVERVKSLMGGLSPMIKPTYSQTAPYYDDSLKAHMTSVEYRNFRKI